MVMFRYKVFDLQFQFGNLNDALIARISFGKVLTIQCSFFIQLSAGTRKSERNNHKIFAFAGMTQILQSYANQKYALIKVNLCILLCFSVYSGTSICPSELESEKRGKLNTPKKHLQIAPFLI